MFPMNLKAGICVLTLCCALAPRAEAAGDARAEKAPDSYTLGEVVVSGERADGAPGERRA